MASVKGEKKQDERKRRDRQIAAQNASMLEEEAMSVRQRMRDSMDLKEKWVHSPKSAQGFADLDKPS